LVAICGLARRIASQQGHQVTFFKQVELQQAQNLQHAFIQLRVELEKG
jgi:hypothetical protein